MRIALLFLLFSLLSFAKEFVVSSEEEFYLALKASQNNEEDDTIILKKGRYVASEKYIFRYEAIEDFDITIKGEDGAKRDEVEIDGNGLAPAFTVINPQNKIVINISNLTIKNGYSKQNGGGILIKNGGDLVLDNVVVAYNKAKYDGAGVYAPGTIIVTDSNISRNKSRFGVGGGIFTGRNAIITSSTISYNSSYKQGGGIFSTKTALIKNSTFSHNGSGYGGAFYGITRLKVTDSKFSNNIAKHDGGAIKCEGDGATIIDTNLSNNRAGNYGGAIFVSDLYLKNGNLSSNSAKYGGAIFVSYAEVKSSKFTNNQATYSGGAIKGDNVLLKHSLEFNNSSERNGGAIDSLRVVIADSVLKNNGSGKGGAIFSKDITITNCTLTENRAKISGGGVKGYKITIRYSTLCDNEAQKSGGAIEGVDITITNSNISNNRSYRGGGINGSTLMAKINITNVVMYKNSAQYGGAIYGNVKISNSLFIYNYGIGMTLYGKGLLTNNIIRNFTAPDMMSQEIFMVGDLQLENNYLNLSNIYNYRLYRLVRKGNLPLNRLDNPNDLTSVFGSQSPITKIGIYPDLDRNCSDVFDVSSAYEKSLKNAMILIDGNDTNDTDLINRLVRKKKSKSRTSIYADVVDLIVDGNQKIFYEQYFIIVTRDGKYPIQSYYIDFGDGNGFQKIPRSTFSHRFKTAGIKDIVVKIVDTEGHEAVKKFPLDIYELNQDEFRELLRDSNSRKYLESLSNGVVNVAENQSQIQYRKAIGLLDKSNSGKDIQKRYQELFSELQSENSSYDEYNISKMIQFNQGIKKAKKYILNNLEEFNLVSKEESIEAVENAKRYIIEHPEEFNLTSFKNYREIVTDIQQEILANLDDYNLTYKSNVEVAYKKGQKSVVENPKQFNLLTTKELQQEMIKLTNKIKSDPAKYGIRVTRKVIESLDKGWSLLGTLAPIEDVSIFDSAKIVWIFADGQFQGYSGDANIKRKIRKAGFKVFRKVPKHAGIWLYK